MPLFHVYKKEWCEHSETRGLLVRTTTWQRAKGIAMEYWKDQQKENILVKKYEDIEEGIICPIDGGVWNNTSYN